MISKLLSFILILFLLSPGLACAAEEEKLQIIHDAHQAAVQEIKHPSAVETLTSPSQTVRVDRANETASVVPEKGVIVTASTSRDEGKEMVKDAIKETPQEWADAALSENWGVKPGTLPDEVNASPSAKLIYGIAAAEQHPESLQWVLEERERDYMTYVLCGLIILVWIQKIPDLWGKGEK